MVQPTKGALVSILRVLPLGLSKFVIKFVFDEGGILQLSSGKKQCLGAQLSSLLLWPGRVQVLGV